MSGNVVNSLWYGIKLPVMGKRNIGIVAWRCDVTGKLKFYIGLGHGDSLFEDEMRVAEHGVPFYPEIFVDWTLNLFADKRRDDVPEQKGTAGEQGTGKPEPQGRGGTEETGGEGD